MSASARSLSESLRDHEVEQGNGAISGPLGSDRLDWTLSGTRLDLRVRREERYEIIVERGVAGRCGPAMWPVLRALDAPSIVVVTDALVQRLALAGIMHSLGETGMPLSVLSVRNGERSKSRATAERLLDGLRHAGAQRRSVLVAVGGGVMCDLVGHVASQYMRGLPYVNIPTSLMAQVDGAIGGKVAVNHPEAKNLIGAFHHPVQVLVDVDTIATLPKREVSNGLAEVVKVAIITDPALFALVEGLDLDEGRTSLDTIEAIVLRAIAAKLELLSCDPFERVLRRALNFGHSLGHALESATGYRVYRHGEAVSVGMAIATEVAYLTGLCDETTRARIVRTLRRLSLPVSIAPETFGSVWDHVQIIQRIRNGSLNFVVPRSIGSVEIIGDVSPSLLSTAVDRLAMEHGA